MRTQSVRLDSLHNRLCPYSCGKRRPSHLNLKLPNDDTLADHVLATMAVVFFGLAVFFFASGVVDSIDGNVSARGGDILRSQSPELFAQVVRRTFGFGAAMIGVSALCATVSRFLRPKA